MPARRFPPQARIALGAACLVALAWVGFVSVTGMSAARYETAFLALGRDETQLKEIQQKLQELRAAQGAALSLPEEALWQDVGESGASLQFQRTLIQAAEDSGLAVSSYSTAVGPTGLRSPSVGLQLEATSDYKSLSAFLQRLDAMTPRISIASLWIGHSNPKTDRPTEALISLRLVAWGFTRDGGKP